MSNHSACMFLGALSEVNVPKSWLMHVHIVDTKQPENKCSSSPANKYGCIRFAPHGLCLWVPDAGVTVVN